MRRWRTRLQATAKRRSDEGLTVDWSALGGNPVPGSVPAVRDLACLMRDIQRDAESALDRLLVIQDQAGEGIWTGVAADEFRADLAAALPDLRRLAQSHGDAGRALFDYAQKLEEAQRLARDAASAATVAVDRRNHAEHDIKDAGEEVGRRAGRVDQLDRDFHQAQLRLNLTAGDLAAQMRLEEEIERNRQMRSSAWQAVAEAKARKGAAEKAKALAEEHLREAQRLAQQAGSIRADGGQHVARRINDAADAGIVEKPWYEKAVDAVVDTVKKVASSPAFSRFLDVLDSLSEVVFIVGTVAAIVVAVATLNPALGFAVFGATTAIVKGIEIVALAGKTLAWSVGARPGKELLIDALWVLVPGKVDKVVKWGGMIKRSINVRDARRVTGFFRQFHAAPRPPIGAESFFRVKTGVDIFRGSLEIGKDINILGKNPVELTHEITSCSGDEGMGIKR